MAFRVLPPERIDFDSSTGEDKGREQRRRKRFDVGPGAEKAHAFINGFKIGFINNERPVGQIEINTKVIEVKNNKADVELVFALRDKSGFDNDYNGFIDVALIVET